MKRLISAWFFMMACVFSAVAQQGPPDPAFQQAAIMALRDQRTDALDKQAACTANATKIAGDLAQAQTRIKALEDKYDPKPIEPAKPAEPPKAE